MSKCNQSEPKIYLIADESDNLMKRMARVRRLWISVSIGYYAERMRKLKKALINVLMGYYVERTRRVKRLRLDAAIFARWVIQYALRSDFRYMVDTPVFIVGCGHSGTTLLLRIVGSHPNFHAILSETYTFRPSSNDPLILINSANLRRRLSVSRKLAQSDLEAFGSGKRRWIEKTPLHIYHIEDILMSRPKSKILLIIRDGRDVVVSIKRRSGDFESAVRRWVNDNKAAENWWDHSQVFVVRYESLVDRFRETTVDIMSFLGEEFSEQCYQYHLRYLDREKPLSLPEGESGEDHGAYRIWQVQQPIFDGRGRWIGAMTSDEKRLFKKLAGEMLAKYGYSRDCQW